MANKNVQEKELSIKWLEQTDKIIRFNEIDTTFDISEAVANFDFKKAGVDSGSRVSVKIDMDQGENGTVVYMTKSKGGSTSAGSSSASAPSGNGTVKTVKLYGTKYSGSLMFENEEEWYSCDKKLDIVDRIAEFKGKQVEITTRTTEKGKKVITSINVVGEGSSTSTSRSSDAPKNEYSKSASGDSRQTSIEVQSCINNANLFYAHVLAGQSMATLIEKQAEIDQMIQHRALKNLELIKTLKTQA